MKFVFAKPHPLVPPCWYRVLENAQDVMDAHAGVCRQAARRYANPHMSEPDGTPKSVIAEAMHPVRLGTGWLKTALNILAENGVVFMGTKSGMCDPGSAIILDQRESDTWPGCDKTKVQVFKWSGGQHYYADCTLYDFGKTDTYEEMVKAIRTKIPEADIRLMNDQGPYFYRTEGD